MKTLTPEQENKVIGFILRKGQTTSTVGVYVYDTQRAFRWELDTRYGKRTIKRISNESNEVLSTVRY